MNTETTPSRAMNAVMTKDRAAWLDCFAEGAVLRDPVGGSPLDPQGEGLVGKEALARFWDAAIAPARHVNMTVRKEYASGSSVARVAHVEIDLGHDRPVEYEGVFVYDLDAQGRIAHLHGYYRSPFGA